jgi:HD-GYP domain-containing protein (c-di-GMP phosphodiesterase class II)
MKTMRAILPIIYQHHERLDGSGYPDGVSGNDIPQAVRTVSVADVFDALTTTRAYRPAMTFEQAWKEIDGEVARGLLDPDSVTALKESVAVTGIRRDPGAPAALSGLFRF